MACEEDFCKDYFVLKPEHASLFDLIRILCSSSFGERRFVESSGANNLGGLGRRWLIFISVLVQKVLIYLRKPMAWIGYVLEMWLNLLASNGGFGLLLLNLLKGSMVKPDKSSATFASVVGNLDKRVELEKNMNTSDSRYEASLSIMASKLSYENEAFVQDVVADHWKMEFYGLFNFWNGKKQLTQGGTEPFNADQWQTDVDISWYELQGMGRIHGGFMKALGLQKKTGWPKEIAQGLGREYAYYTIRQKLRDELNKNEKAKFMLTGHSLGGALAILFVAVLGLHEEGLLERLEGVYTFGQPRVGDEKFGEFMKEKLRVYGVKYLRYVYCNDMVARLPYDDQTLLYKHFGLCLYFNSCYKGKAMWEAPDKNYFSLLWAIPKNLNAVWELIRTFIIPRTKGPDYKEGWFLRLLRVFGLAIPGLSAHCPPDYVNVTRLGSLPSQILVQDLTQQRRKHY
ncbi:alpha/beta-Hydrolases superfamily protein [Actinidia rufa]|uniref:Alpha/beta-Hydrolases superfamily protein n=1 Tax=Actinidia rufa TaxID=165716 RepID=A0A7J0EK69_9ERIC|nr:alpha/beta-Hydrolases superfamily protein [Actinidia rufa]